MKKYISGAALLFVLVLAVLPPRCLAAQTSGATTQDIFKQFSEHVVKI